MNPRKLRELAMLSELASRFAAIDANQRELALRELGLQQDVQRRQAEMDLQRAEQEARSRYYDNALKTNLAQLIASGANATTLQPLFPEQMAPYVEMQRQQLLQQASRAFNKAPASEAAAQAMRAELMSRYPTLSADDITTIINNLPR